MQNVKSILGVEHAFIFIIDIVKTKIIKTGKRLSHSSLEDDLDFLKEKWLTFSLSPLSSFIVSALKACNR